MQRKRQRVGCYLHGNTRPGQGGDGPVTRTGLSPGNGVNPSKPIESGGIRRVRPLLSRGAQGAVPDVFQTAGVFSGGSRVRDGRGGWRVCGDPAQRSRRATTAVAAEPAATVAEPGRDRSAKPSAQPVAETEAAVSSPASPASVTAKPAKAEADLTRPRPPSRDGRRPPRRSPWFRRPGRRRRPPGPNRPWRARCR